MSLALWLPSPPRDGDAVYNQGAVVGTFHGEPVMHPGHCGWYVVTVETALMPPAYAEYVRRKMAERAAPSPPPGA